MPMPVRSLVTGGSNADFDSFQVEACEQAATETTTITHILFSSSWISFLEIPRRCFYDLHPIVASTKHAVLPPERNGWTIHDLLSLHDDCNRENRSSAASTGSTCHPFSYNGDNRSYHPPKKGSKPPATAPITAATSLFPTPVYLFLGWRRRYNPRQDGKKQGK